jgi:hypothetical protein
MDLGRFSLGIGDRFGRQGRAQLAALEHAQALGVAITPVWNKSNREHQLIGTTPADTRRAADAAVRASGWHAPYFVDADHISLATVDGFLASSDFFTLDVSAYVGLAPDGTALTHFLATQEWALGTLHIPGIAQPLTVTPTALATVAETYLRAVQEAGRLFRHIAAAKGEADFVVEVSLDEATRAQSPSELLFILAMLAAEGVPVDTIAPKFSGEFHKGVDYLGEVAGFAREFADDLAVLAFAVHEFGLPAALKLSVHSGSDKFSLYGPMAQLLARTGAGVHLKTAGTTWLAEVIGLAQGDIEGVTLVKTMYRQAFARQEELCAPYATVVAIDPARLPTPNAVDRWDGSMLVDALRHVPTHPRYNSDLRQLMHLAYKVAAEIGSPFYYALDQCAAPISAEVTDNLFTRHIRPLFVSAEGGVRSAEF